MDMPAPPAFAQAIHRISRLPRPARICYATGLRDNKKTRGAAMNEISTVANNLPQR